MKTQHHIFLVILVLVFLGVIILKSFSIKQPTNKLAKSASDGQEAIQLPNVAKNQDDDNLGNKTAEDKKAAALKEVTILQMLRQQKKSQAFPLMTK